MCCTLVHLSYPQKIISMVLTIQIIIILLTNICELFGNSIHNTTNNQPALDGNPASIANIPDTIVALDNLRSSLNDVLEDFKVATNKNQSKVNPIEEDNVPLTLNDVRDIEHNGDNPLDPANIDMEDVAPRSIPLDHLSLMNKGSEQDDISARNTAEEVCGCDSNHKILEDDSTTATNRRKRQIADAVIGGRIVGGFDSVPNSFPWQLFIRIFGSKVNEFTGKRRQFKCGGSILNKKFGLSAMHCFWVNEKNGININLDKPGRDVLVVAGVHDVCINPAVNKDHGWQLTYLKKVHHQGNFDPALFDNDVAVLEFTKTFELKRGRVMPVCLPSMDYRGGKSMLVSGWGHMSHGGMMPCELKYLKMPLLDHQKCKQTETGKLYEKIAGRPYPEVQICAGFLEGGKDACQGDSGGGLVTLSPVTNNIELVGVVSWGSGCARKGFPGSYANVIKYKEFIEATIAPGECVNNASQILEKKSAMIKINASTLTGTSVTTPSKFNIPGVSVTTVNSPRNIEAKRALGTSTLQQLASQVAVPKSSEPRPSTIKSQLISTPIIINGHTGSYYDGILHNIHIYDTDLLKTAQHPSPNASAQHAPVTTFKNDIRSYSKQEGYRMTIVPAYPTISSQLPTSAPSSNPTTQKPSLPTYYVSSTPSIAQEAMATPPRKRYTKYPPPQTPSLSTRYVPATGSGNEIKSYPEMSGYSSTMAPTSPSTSSKVAIPPQTSKPYTKYQLAQALVSSTHDYYPSSTSPNQMKYFTNNVQEYTTRVIRTYPTTLFSVVTPVVTAVVTPTTVNEGSGSGHLG